MLNEAIEAINDSHKTLWILCGLPYSGKTYLSREVLKNTSAVYVSIDEIFKKAGFDWDLNNLPNEKQWEEIFNASYQKSQDALSRGLNVLYDSTNHTKESRDKLREIAGEVGANAAVIYIDVPVDVIMERWEKNFHDKSRSVVSKELVTMTIDAFEPPEPDENVIYIENM